MPILFVSSEESQLSRSKVEQSGRIRVACIFEKLGTNMAVDCNWDDYCELARFYTQRPMLLTDKDDEKYEITAQKGRRSNRGLKKKWCVICSWRTWCHLAIMQRHVAIENVPLYRRLTVRGAPDPCWGLQITLQARILGARNQLRHIPTASAPFKTFGHSGSSTRLPSCLQICPLAPTYRVLEN